MGKDATCLTFYDCPGAASRSSSTLRLQSQAFCVMWQLSAGAVIERLPRRLLEHSILFTYSAANSHNGSLQQCAVVISEIL